MRYRFRDCELDEQTLELRRAGGVVETQRRVLSTLLYLIQHRDRVVTREELVEGPWEGTLVSDAAFSQAIMQARKAVGDTGQEQHTIRTVRGVGFRFVADVETASSPARPAPDSAPDPSAGLLGRKGELGRLDDALGRALSGNGGAVLLTGEAGIGKTTLAEALVRRARAVKAEVAWAQAWEGPAPPYWLWTQLLRTALTLPVASGIAEELRGQIARLDAGREGAGADSPAERFQRYDAVARFLRDVARPTGLLLVADDLHNADRTSLGLLDFMATQLRGSRVLIVATAREAELRVRAGSGLCVAFGRAADRIALGGLDQEALARLVTEAALHPCSEELLGRIHEVTRGNPLFAQEIARELSRAPEARLAGGELPLPERVSGAILSRLAGLSAATRALLEIAAVGGSGLDPAVLARLGGTTASSVIEALDEVYHRDLIVPDPDRPGCFRFAHALVQSSLYDALPTARRLELHRAFAEDLEARCATAAEPPWAEMADHLERAGASVPTEKVVMAAVAAADQAMRQLAYERAAEHFEHALRRVEAAGGDARTTGRLLLGLGNAQRLGGATLAALDAFERAARLGQERGIVSLLGLGALGFGVTRRESGVPSERLIALLEAALAALSDRPTRLRAGVLARLGSAISFRGGADRERSDRLTREAVDLARSLGDRSTLAGALLSRHFARWGRDSPEGLLAVCDEILQMCGTEAEFSYARQEARLWCISDLLELGRMREARDAARVYDQEAERSRVPMQLANAGRLRAVVAAIAGSFDDAVRFADAALAVARRAGDPNAAGFHLALSSTVALDRRDLAALRELRPRIEAMLDVQPGLTVWEANLAHADALVGDKVSARQRLRALGRRDELPENHTRLAALWALAHTSALLDAAPEAELLLDELMPYRGRHVVAGSAAAYHGPVDHALGLLERVTGDRRAAERSFRSALDQARAVGAVGARRRAAEALAQTVEDPGEAAEFWAEAQDLWERPPGSDDIGYAASS